MAYDPIGYEAIGTVSPMGSIPYYNQNDLQQLYQQPQRQYAPLEPRYDFKYNNPYFEIERKHFKLMPEGFDYLSERVIKKLKPVKEGGERKVRKMPRLFKFALYLALVWIVWDIVFNFNYIISFIVHAFILHK